MKKNKGFTLIELLVVIAIIGILSAVVLTNLGSARNKAKAASATASISSTRTTAELGANASGTYVVDICNSTATGGLDDLITAAEAQGATVSCGQNTAVGAAPASWAVAADLADGTHFCADSTGFAGASSVAATTEVAAGYTSADVVCNE
jgi:type IV pilus assembly protein PilA